MSMEAKPDYDHWDQEREFTLRVAAWLCCDWEPRKETRDNPLPIRVSELERQLWRDGVLIDDTSRRAPAAFQLDPRNGFVPIANSFTRIIPGEKYVSRSALNEWAERTGRRPPFLYPDERDNRKPKEWGFAHDTELLKIARLVIAEHWEGKNPAQAPSREWMVDHIQEKYRVSKGAAEAIDQVTRHDSRSRSKTAN
jgi:hypothetical protein